MATTKVLNLLSRASTLIQDATNVRWPVAELLNWLNDGQREVVLIRPQASVTNSSVALTAGSTKQTLPALGLMLIDVTRNMGASGTSAGKAIRLVSREVLDAQNPEWHQDAADATYGIKHFMYDPRDPKSYYVYPKAPATTWYVELVFASSPTDCTSGTNDVIQIDDIYANALLDYVLYRAYSKDAEYAQNAQLAVAHYTAFQNALGVKTSQEVAQNPNLTAGNFNPNVAGAARQ